jgi:D-sedoheptulose 7-phosphate isomerase
MHDLIKDLIKNYPDLAECAADIQHAFEVMRATFERGGKLLVCGNGGSAADSEHIVGELMKAFTIPRPLPDDQRQKLIDQFPDNGAYLADHLQGALPAISLVSQSGLITAFSNDVAPDMVFAQQVYGYGKPGDCLLGISTSGNSANVVNALQVARALGVATVGLTGRDGGAMRDHCDAIICVTSVMTAPVQERHLPVYHVLCTMLETTFFKTRSFQDNMTDEDDTSRRD